MWKTKTRHTIRISAMTTKHIEASIAIILRGGLHDREAYVPRLRAELDRRVAMGDFYTGATTSTEPFSLGLPGEEWKPELPALAVPVDTPYGFIYATRMDADYVKWAMFYGGGKYGSGGRQWSYFTDLILLVAAIHEHERSFP